MPIRGQSTTKQSGTGALKQQAEKTAARNGKGTNTKSTRSSIPKGVTATATTTAEPQPTSNAPAFTVGVPGGGITTNAPRTTPTGTNAAPGRVGGSSIAGHRSSLDGVSHGLNLPHFEANSHFAPNLFTNSSSLPETSQADADAAVLSIERKRQTLRIVRANIGLNTDVVMAATEQQKLNGEVIRYSTQLVNNQTLFTQYIDAGVKQNIANTKLAQSQERFAQENIVLQGMQAETPLIEQQWQARLELHLAGVNAIREQTLRANQTLAQKRRELEGMFDVQFQTV